MTTNRIRGGLVLFLGIFVYGTGTACSKPIPVEGTYSSESHKPDAEHTVPLRNLGSHGLTKPVLLDGIWGFLWTGDGSRAGANRIRVPGAWNNQQRQNENYPSFGAATYQLNVRLPPDPGRLALYSSRQGTAWSVTVNGTEIGRSGQVGPDSRSHRPAFFIRPLAIPADLVASGEVEIRIFVSNFTDRSGGLWNPFFLGKEEDISKIWLSRLIFDVFTFSAILAIGLYHAALFLSRREDIGSLSFSAVCFVIALRVMTTGEHVLEFFFPGIPFEIMRKLEYLSFYAAVPLFLSFLALAMEEIKRRALFYIVWPPAMIFGIIVLLFPISVYSHTLIYYFAFFAFCLILGVAIWMRALKRKRPGALASLMGGIIFVGAAVHDMLYASEVYLTNIGNLAGFGLIVFLLSQSYLIARIFSLAFRQSKVLSNTLMETNRAYARFVPTEFLNHLQRDDIREVKLGDQTERQMSILFTDIRSFTNLSEKMSPEENFRFLNSYLKRVVPCISEEGGFVDKYIGDAIMALFSGPPEQALKSAIRIHQQVRIYNQHRQKQGYDPIRVGIGLHFGRLMLGTIGSEDRMESTVISDAVNTASRIERLTRNYGSPILVSDAFLRSLSHPQDFHSRLVDRVQVKGREEPILVHEVLDGQAQWVLDLFELTRVSFEEGVRAAHERRWAECERRMDEVLRENPSDLVAEMYLNRARNQGPPP